MTSLPRCVLEGEKLARRASAEWLLTNGLGGFALGTACGIPERRYHAWLVAAMRPPLGRVVALHSAAEWLVLEPARGGTPERIDLTSYRFHDGTISPKGVTHLVQFDKTPLACRWTYEVRASSGTQITYERELTLRREENAAYVLLTVKGAPGRAWIEWRGFTPMRDFHELCQTCEASRYHVSTSDASGAGVRVGLGEWAVRLDASRGSFRVDPQVWRACSYTRDAQRGQSHVEDLFSPGVFVAEVGASATGAGGDGDRVLIAARMLDRTSASAEQGREDIATISARDRAREEEEQRLSRWIEAARGKREALPVSCTAHETRTNEETRARLVCAADQFVVRRDMTISTSSAREVRPARLTSVIAGYPWFSDWGRDTLISLPGLLLSCGRFAEARDVLRVFATLQRDGLIPNCFDDAQGIAQYNTVDASLWYIRAACAYRRDSGDRESFSGEIGHACQEVVRAYMRGTRFGIRVDEDGLVAAGDAGTQLTWMDGARDGVIFTPRFGKPVEINALWHSALLELAEATRAEDRAYASQLEAMAKTCATSFARNYWNERDGCLFDTLVPEAGGWGGVAELRPNQIFAVSLPHSPLSHEVQRHVLACVRKELLTPVGVRTLARREPCYRARYDGDLFSRDGAYHNGTVWAWLIGPLAEATMRVDRFSAPSRHEAAKMLGPIVEELGDASSPGAPIMTLPEIYDAEPGEAGARRAEGCPVQAWSIAEVLRVWKMTQEVREEIGPSGRTTST